MAGSTILLALLAEPAHARSFRVNEVPNGTQRSCLTCHETNGGIVFNAFGSDVRSFLVGEGAAGSRHVEWGPELAGRDSDGDGFTNGQELGDPDGTWRIGDPNPGGTASAPGDPASVPNVSACGDGVLSAAETCEGDQLRGATCESQNLGGGTLTCNAECRLDTSGCNASAGGDDDGAGDGDEDGDGPSGDDEDGTTSADAGGCAVVAGAGSSAAGAPTSALALVVVGGGLAARGRARARTRRG